MNKHYKHLTREQRYYIALKMSNNVAPSKIAKAISVHLSTVYREIERNSLTNGKYHYMAAQGKYEVRRSNASKSNRFAKLKPKALKYIIDKLAQQWSPEQIAGRMVKDLKVKVSYKTIYKYIRHDRNCGGYLYKLLPRKGKKYKYRSEKRSSIPNRVDISKRPKIIEKKKRIGDFEADTIIGRRGGTKTCLLTLVDRKSKLTIIRKLNDKSALSVQRAIEDVYSSSIMPIITITPDNGTEFYNHQVIAANIGCKFYFARPYRSCDRGLNEHINGNIRYFLPKKTDFANITDDKILAIQDNLNNRPRKSLGFLTPNEVMSKYLKRTKRKNL